ncbi:uncharacterized protein LOC144139043 [Haemaphysalis longicornis]
MSLRLLMRDQAPKGCNAKLTVTIPEDLSMQNCVTLMNGFCDLRIPFKLKARVGLFFESLACFLKRVPMINLPELLKEITCFAVKQTLNAVAREPRTPAIVLFSLKVVKLLLNCDPHTPILRTSERSLASK